MGECVHVYTQQDADHVSHVNTLQLGTDVSRLVCAINYTPLHHLVKHQNDRMQLHVHVYWDKTNKHCEVSWQTNIVMSLSPPHLNSTFLRRTVSSLDPRAPCREELSLLSCVWRPGTEARQCQAYKAVVTTGTVILIKSIVQVCKTTLLH